MNFDNLRHLCTVIVVDARGDGDVVDAHVDGGDGGGGAGRRCVGDIRDAHGACVVQAQMSSLSSLALS
eukprot:CAMPEP_0113855610 /NCGR_PEP_ID=MMETSP0372-20130328/8412_1 /TAXON_ID=340204 /ORGANISM="Lankesteria abbotti" /LENGTH=67 /DNA_ID=CAMNT_0000829791 /DNA_START=23 /DNA_END=226 /DNA_ORIENTATION=- /assembly_acc=CAM_ASM_000359